VHVVAPELPLVLLPLVLVIDVEPLLPPLLWVPVPRVPLEDPAWLDDERFELPPEDEPPSTPLLEAVLLPHATATTTTDTEPRAPRKMRM